MFCVLFKFEFDDFLWEFMGEGSYYYNRFIVLLVELCLYCDNVLVMNNMFFKVIVYGIIGFLLVMKVMFCCNWCKISYGILFFFDEKGKYLYFKKYEFFLVEVSNVIYVEKNLYKWILSFG